MNKLGTGLVFLGLCVLVGAGTYGTHYLSADDRPSFAVLIGAAATIFAG
jgi:hypothetical protein